MRCCAAWKCIKWWELSASISCASLSLVQCSHHVQLFRLPVFKRTILLLLMVNKGCVFCRKRLILFLHFSLLFYFPLIFFLLAMYNFLFLLQLSHFHCFTRNMYFNDDFAIVFQSWSNCNWVQFSVVCTWAYFCMGGFIWIGSRSSHSTSSSWIGCGFRTWSQ